MKQKLLLTLTFIALLLIVDNAFTSSGVPPIGRTGAPGESTCAASGCHTGNAVVANSSFLAVTSASSTLFTDGYTPGQTYNIIVNLSTNTPRYGFQLTVLDNLNNNAAGTLALLPNPTSTSLNNAGGRQYVGHLNANSINAWSFTWTAPAAGTDTVVFYASGNASNNNGGTSGDIIHTNSFKLHERVSQPVSGCDEIFISEYVEGSGFNKAIELYNPTANPIDLSNYRMAQYNNGSATPGVYSALSGIIQPYGTRVLVLDKRTGNPATDPDLAAKADTFMNPTNTAEFLYFNGDDALVLERLNGTVVDIFGKIGQDPGSAWSGGGVSTVNRTLVRKPGVTQGVTSSPATFDPSIEWISYPQNFFDSLGTHLSACSPTFCNTLELTATPTDVSCNGGTDGEVTLTATGGTGVYSYNSTPLSGLSAGNYTYIVTDDFGCADTTNATITEPAALTVVVVGNDPNCSSNDGEAYAAATGGTLPYSFNWSGGTPNAAGDTITNLTAGTYSVSVTDNNGCTASGTVALTAPLVAQQPTIINGDVTACLGTETYSVAAQTGVTFTWAVSAGATITPNGNQASVNYTAAGSYTISVTASTTACGNAPVQTLAVSVVETPSVPTVSGAAVACLPATELYSVPSAAGVTYNWALGSGGTVTPVNNNSINITWSSVGTHTISVTASNICGTSAAGTLAVSVGNPSVSLGNDTTACGQVGLGATGFASYQWSTGASTNQINVTQSGNIGLTVTDNLGCTANDAVNVTITPGPTLTLPATATDCDTAVVNAGGNFTSYAWSNGQTTSIGSFTQSGTYTLTVTDAGGCSVSDDVVVTIFPEPDPSLPTTATDCDTVQVGGAGGFASYLWSTGETTQIATFTASGFYSLTVTDTNGCVGSGTFEAILTGSTASAGFTYTANGLDVDFTDASTGGNTYAWDFGDGTSSSSQNPSVTYAAEGSYAVSLTVSDNCGSDTFTDTVTVITIGVTNLAGVNALEVYPNPTNRQLQVTWGAVSGTATIEVWNTLGQRLQVAEADATSATQTMDVQDLPSGIYMLRIQVGDNNKLVKFVKE